MNMAMASTKVLKYIEGVKTTLTTMPRVKKQCLDTTSWDSFSPFGIFLSKEKLKQAGAALGQAKTIT